MSDKWIFRVRHLNFYYGKKQVLFDISMDIERNQITALIGPSGCGKTTFLRCFNRMHDLYKGNRYEGEILYNGQDILRMKNIMELRSRIGMVFQSPTPFPMSIFDNVAYGLRLNGIRNRAELEDRVEDALRKAALWEEVKDRLGMPASGLSGGQQQRLVIARALAVEPDVILFDEPTSALDPIATARIEELMVELKRLTTIIVVTHNMQQASRVADYTAFFYMGRLIEMGKTDEFFTRPKNKQTEDYITGRFG